MAANKDQKRQKDNPVDKTKEQNKKFTPPPKPFQQFSNPNKFSGGPPKSYNAFHRRLGK
jgi:hypothetical protein